VIALKRLSVLSIGSLPLLGALFVAVAGFARFYNAQDRSLPKPKLGLIFNRHAMTPALERRLTNPWVPLQDPLVCYLPCRKAYSNYDLVINQIGLAMVAEKFLFAHPGRAEIVADAVQGFPVRLMFVTGAPATRRHNPSAQPWAFDYDRMSFENLRRSFASAVIHEGSASW
jgi:hypothetical protein